MPRVTSADVVPHADHHVKIKFTSDKNRKDTQVLQAGQRLSSMRLQVVILKYIKNQLAFTFPSLFYLTPQDFFSGISGACQTQVSPTREHFQTKTVVQSEKGELVPLEF